jgi:glycosyltransferase involved in cell wall biosynthesis
MKILQVCHSFYPCFEAGGVVRVVYELSKKLVENGHDVTVYTTDGCKKRLKVKKNLPVDVEGVRTYYFRNLSNVLRIKLKIATPYYLPMVMNKQIQQFDVIHVHECRTVLAILVHHYAKKYGIPYVLQAHGSVLTLFQKQSLKKLYDWVWGYKILKDASKVIALTRTEVDQYKMMGVDEDKIEIVPNGIDLSDYEHLPEKGEFRRKYGLKDNEKVILYIGRLHKTKGVDLLVKAFSDISKELNNVKLVLVGPDDGYQSALEKLIKTLKVEDNVLFTGFVTSDEKMAALVNADVFVTPSFSGFPVTFLEACACGTPIITTNNGDELDWIDDKAGYVVEHYDKDQLRDAIDRILGDESMRDKLGEEGKRLVRAEFLWDNVVERVVDIYMNCRSYIKQKVI